MNNTKKLTSQWYNAIVQSCELDSRTFQLVKGLLSAQDNLTIWKIMDRIPPESINQIDDQYEFGSNSFSTHYGAVINNLYPQDSSVSDMQNLLGDHYISWANYKTPPNPIPYLPAPDPDREPDPLEIVKFQFQNWCLDSGQSQAKIELGIDLISDIEQQMKELLGDDYSSWADYTTAHSTGKPSPSPTEPLVDISKYKKAQFQNWCLESGQSQETIFAGIAILSQVDFISAAAAKWKVASEKKIFAYSATAQDLKNAIDRGQAKTVDFNSKTQSSDTSSSWASGKVSGGYGFFGASTSASWDKFSQDIQQQGVQLEVQYDKVATLTGSPLTNPNTLDVDLSKYLPWYDSKVIQTAYAQNDNNLWKRTAPTWEDTFGLNGNLKNLTIGLIVVDGITTTMTTTASVSQSERESFRAAASAGYWPFFKAQGEGGWNTNVSFNDNGSISVTSSSKAGNPNVLGVLVSPFKKAFTG
jgi:hypothetical protein